MGRGQSSRSNKKSWEEQLQEVENRELVEMAAATKIWLAPSTKEKDLRELRDQRLLSEQRLGEWREPGEHRVPSLNPSEIVLFVPFIRHGLGLPACPFFRGFLHFYRLTLNHLNPNSILHLSCFVHLCETFLGTPPSITLFCYFFRLKPHPSAAKPNVLGGAAIQLRTRKKAEYLDYSLVDSCRD
jgi:hypothetical protein